MTSEPHRTGGPDPVQDLLAELVVDRPGAVVVDVGGGSGTRAVPLARLGCRVTVVDASIDALAILHRRSEDAGVADRVTGVQADADALGTVVPPGEADLVLCHHVLEQVDDPTAAAAALAASLRSGGLVSVLVAGRLAAVLAQAQLGRFAEAEAVLGDPAGRYGPSDPLRRRYDVAAITDLLTHVGLQVESVSGLGIAAGLLPASGRTQNGPALAALEARLADHEVLRAIAGALHVVARRP